MAVIEGGTSAALTDVGSNTKAMRIEALPTDVGSLGAYQIVATSGTVAAGLAAAAPVFSFRWGDASRACLIKRVSMVAKNAGTAFTAGAQLHELLVARSFTASDTGGTSVLPTGNSQKKRTSFGTTLVTDMRIASTGTLTAGTRTLDGAAVGALRGLVPATQTSYIMVGASSNHVPGAATTAFVMDWADLYVQDTGDEWPLVLVQNEGFIIRSTVPATGTWDFSIRVQWTEVATTAGFN